MNALPMESRAKSAKSNLARLDAMRNRWTKEKRKKKPGSWCPPSASDMEDAQDVASLARHITRSCGSIMSDSSSANPAVAERCLAVLALADEVQRLAVELQALFSEQGAAPDAVTSQVKPEPRLRLVHPSSPPIRARASRGLPSGGSPR